MRTVRHHNSKVQVFVCYESHSFEKTGHKIAANRRKSQKSQRYHDDSIFTTKTGSLVNFLFSRNTQRSVFSPSPLSLALHIHGVSFYVGHWWSATDLILDCCLL